jgi:hypothetical protein
MAWIHRACLLKCRQAQPDRFWTCAICHVTYQGRVWAPALERALSVGVTLGLLSGFHVTSSSWVVYAVGNAVWALSYLFLVFCTGIVWAFNRGRWMHLVILGIVLAPALTDLKPHVDGLYGAATLYCLSSGAIRYLLARWI